jgi:hypothetical protein
MNTYELTINNPDTTSQLRLTTAYPEEVMRLLQLSGQSAHVPEPVQAPAMHMPDCGCDTCAPDAMMEQQAEHDYGHDGAEDAVAFDIKDYNFKGRADLPERLTSARYGSNPIKSEMKEHISYDAIRAAYEEFLAESENEAGLMSPLTANHRDEFDHDPLADQDAVTDGSHSPLSTIKLQDLPK